MDDFRVSELLRMQAELQAAHAGDWAAMEPRHGRESLLWTVEEIGEMAALIKKQGDTAIMESPAVRGAFVEELCDVLMYLGDVMLCYSITQGEVAEAFYAKHAKNMKRDYASQYALDFEDSPENS